MKCVETTRDEADVSVGSLVVAAAILVMLIEDVLVARMACLGQISASWEKIWALRLGISGTASITMSTSERSDIEVEGMRRARAALEASSVMRDFETSFARSLSAKARPLSREAWLLSITRTGTSALRAATRAIPSPCLERRDVL